MCRGKTSSWGSRLTSTMLPVSITLGWITRAYAFSFSTPALLYGPYPSAPVTCSVRRSLQDTLTNRTNRVQPASVRYPLTADPQEGFARFLQPGGISRSRFDPYKPVLFRERRKLELLRSRAWVQPILTTSAHG